MRRIEIVLVALFMLYGGIVQAGVQNQGKYQSLLMYNFAKYSEWSDEHKEGDFVIGVLGESDVFDHLSAITLNKKKGKQTIRVIKFNSHKEITQCHMLFISTEQSDQFNNVLKVLDQDKSIIVTEKPNMCKKGSDFNFVVKGNKLQFEMNRGTNTKPHIQVSMELSKFAILI